MVQANIFAYLIKKVPRARERRRNFISISCYLFSRWKKCCFSYL